MKAQKEKTKRRMRRKRRIRKRVHGTVERPRVTVTRSLRHTYCQFIDDENGRTLLGLGTMSPAFREAVDQEKVYGGNCSAAEVFGRIVAEKAIAAGFKEIVFDRNGYKYHGRVKKFAEALRAGGLKF